MCAHGGAGRGGAGWARALGLLRARETMGSKLVTAHSVPHSRFFVFRRMFLRVFRWFPEICISVCGTIGDLGVWSVVG